jgi:DNA-binding NtrC family response regulator
MGKGRVLIVDDDEDLCSQLAEAMQNEGFKVNYESDPYEAKRLIDKLHFEFALMDYKMQGITGLDLLKIIKEKSPSTKVFLISGRPFIEKILFEENVAHLVSGVLQKPFELDVLLIKMKGQT